MNPEQPVGEYPDLSLTESLQLVQKAVSTANNVALTSLRAAHAVSAELRRQNVALDAKLARAMRERDTARAERDTLRMKAATVTP